MTGAHFIRKLTKTTNPHIYLKTNWILHWKQSTYEFAYRNCKPRGYTSKGCLQGFGGPHKRMGAQGVKTKTNLATVASGEVKMAAKHETTPACYIFYLTKHFWVCYEIIVPERRLAISSRTFFLKNIVHKKVKFGHFVQLIAPTDRWIATYLCLKLLNSGDF